MKLTSVVLVSIVVLGMAGCAATPQAEVPVSKAALSGEAGKIGVVMLPIPKVDTAFPGAACLLCLATASMANSSLTTYTHTLGTEDLPKLGDTVADLVRAKGASVSVLTAGVDLKKLPASTTKAVNTPKKNFNGLKASLGVDKLLVLELDFVGFERSYAAYIAQGEPQASLRGIGYMVDLASNTYDWYEPIAILQRSDGKWDEPPSFPGLPNAYFKVLELGKDTFLAPVRN